MNKKCLSLALAAIGLGSALSTASVQAADPSNTERNKQKGITAQDQKNNYPDLQITKKIRREIMDDESLSNQASNIKIIARNGHVTLDGVVSNDFEKTRIEQIARDVVGIKNFTSLIKIDTPN